MIWIITLIFCTLDAMFNRWLFKRNGKINHWVNVVYRIAFGLIVVLAFHLHGLMLMSYAIGTVVGYSFLFNEEWNYLNHLPFDYQGKTSALDTIELRVPWIAVAVWSVIIAFGFIYGYFHPELYS